MNWSKTTPALLAGLALVAGACGGGDEGPEITRPVQRPAGGEIGKNVARVPGLSAADVAGAAMLAVYPTGGKGKEPNGLMLVRENWQEVAVAAQFAAKPVQAALLVRETDFYPAATADLIARVRPAGFPRGDGLQAIVLGRASGDTIADLQEQKLKLTQLQGSATKLSREVVPFSGGYAERYSDTVAIVSDQEAGYALPGAAWSAYSGDSLLFAGPGGVPKATMDTLVERQKVRLQKPTAYLIGPEKAIPKTVEDELSGVATVKRVGADAANPVEVAIELARYKDRGTGFGWGLTKGPASLLLVNERDWGNAIGALMLSATGPQAPLLLTDDTNRLPAAILRYARGLRDPKQPSQGFVFGDPKSISSDQLRQLDEALRQRARPGEEDGEKEKDGGEGGGD